MKLPHLSFTFLIIKPKAIVLYGLGAARVLAAWGELRRRVNPDNSKEEGKLR